VVVVVVVVVVDVVVEVVLEETLVLVLRLGSVRSALSWQRAGERLRETSSVSLKASGAVRRRAPVTGRRHASA